MWSYNEETNDTSRMVSEAAEGSEADMYFACAPRMLQKKKKELQEERGHLEAGWLPAIKETTMHALDKFAEGWPDCQMRHFRQRRCWISQKLSILAREDQRSKEEGTRARSKKAEVEEPNNQGAHFSHETSTGQAGGRASDGRRRKGKYATWSQASDVLERQQGRGPGETEIVTPHEAVV